MGRQMVDSVWAESMPPRPMVTEIEMGWIIPLAH